MESNIHYPFRVILELLLIKEAEKWGEGLEYFFSRIEVDNLNSEISIE